MRSYVNLDQSLRVTAEGHSRRSEVSSEADGSSMVVISWSTTGPVRYYDSSLDKHLAGE